MRYPHLAAVGLTAIAAMSVALPAASAAVAPSAPASCSATATAGGGLRVTWTQPTSSGSSRVSGYKIAEQGYAKPVVSVKASARSTVWTKKLRDTKDIRFTVRAVSAVGKSKTCTTAALGGTADPAEPAPAPAPAPAPEAPAPGTSEPASEAAALLPYTAESFFKSRVDGADVPVDAARTASFHAFMRSHPDQGGAGITWPKVNMNEKWAMSYHVGRASDPVWRLKGGNTSDPRLRILTTQGFHMADSVADSFPTGDQDRPGVMVDPVFGYTAQFADAVPDKATRTITVSNAGIMWHSSNGLDHRNPVSDDSRNFSSRGRILDAMVIRRDVLDRAIAEGTGLGHVLHLFFVETSTADGFAHPMVGDESENFGWGAEGERIRIKPGIDLAARGLSGACLAVARTMQENGAYIGDNSGSATQIKASQPAAYAGTNLGTDCMKGKVSFDDFEVVKLGWSR
ncbi:fibronectin type III domain-containing protein [Nocardioides caldifontis]|uniref:fibronectin type III domain-containing protein n=1 Tax=Nocardioides caldifontis TaxID=2588938 RepID=UPI0013967DB6|nr:fibronectin type III domain-containing protein [Nocardioides caldifontis]